MAFDRMAGGVRPVRTRLGTLLPGARLDETSDQTGHYRDGIERKIGDNEVPDE